MSDEEIVQACKNSNPIDKDTYYIPQIGRMNPGTIFRISHDTVIKRDTLSPSELDIAELVRQHTCIPVPFHQRCIIPEKAYHKKHLVMQYVEGVTVETLWESMSWWMRFQVALMIRYYVHQLCFLPAQLNLSRPGPVGDYEDLYCAGRLFSDSCPPERFGSYSSLAFYYDECLYVQKWSKKALDDNIVPFDRSRPLAVVHQDLHLSNLMLGKDGQLWVLDWSMAGVYPDWFEYGNMAIYARSPELPSSWKLFIPWMFGKFEAPGQLPFIRAIDHVLLNMPPDFYDVVAEIRAKDKASQA
ncbi:hypothetical protein AX16_007501 [Volvariella volvacea WC 439]|nr:hypothetical protein AX16_007501 [Volvariella volvacea WC 439]